jgi:heme/copper-type cytochrome/quinol oxidase subunit 3
MLQDLTPLLAFPLLFIKLEILGTHMRKYFLLTWSVIGVPLTFAVFIFAAYYVTQPLSMPAYQSKEWLFWLPTLILVTSGILAIYQIISMSRAWKLACIAIYGFTYFWLLAFIGLGIACSFGDCI